MKVNNLLLNFDEINKLIDDISALVQKNKGKKMCIALIGDLGTGKTSFAKKLLSNLGVRETVKSPTFTYLITYETDIDIAHFDMYRINSEDELYDIAYYDYIDNSDLLLIEWADLISNSLPKNCLFFEIKHHDIDTRIISIYEIIGGDKVYVELSNYNFN